MKEDIFNEFNSIEKKINESNLTQEEKKVLNSIFLSLKQYENNCLKAIVDKVNAANDLPNSRSWNKVYVMYVPENQLKIWNNNGFYKVFPDDGFSVDAVVDSEVLGEKETSYGLRIFDGSYEKYVLFLNNNTGKVKHVSSKLEKDLFVAWGRSDAIQSPVLFAPLLRRICRVYDSSVDDACFLRNCVPVWNVEFSKAQKIAEGRVSPDGNEYNYHQSFECPQNAFIYVDDVLADDIDYKIEYSTEMEKGIAEVYSVGTCDFQNVKMVNIHLIEDRVLEKIHNDKLSYFSTIWEHKSNVLPSRLFSQGDIRKLLSCFCNDKYRSEFLKVSNERDKNLKLINRYETTRGFKYPYDVKERDLEMQRRRKPICYLRFIAPSKWLTDYAEYVLSFMEYFYPEFVWAGVVE